MESPPSGLESTSIETRSRLDSFSEVVLTARTSTTSLSQASMRTVPFTLLSSSDPPERKGYVCANSRVTPKHCGARKIVMTNRTKVAGRNTERCMINPPSQPQPVHFPQGNCKLYGPTRPTPGPLLNGVQN